ncbi:hypothetical protein HYH02_006311 [Chlamydomonas schloesseri]|uniref:PhoD-like phosphatase domain-containing protein n=1 Tax=Chlamydomonas schloesseri TaxID=2026947 RepID=A0A836B667_9CHLO|nr:hypothetical protein HYH02_006311 [Chlamydomonas schloesseri]|eukprot:KAG2448419.1 hypothetical protein HYH02_006311 [Chlamydomonas schloesseri]
MGATCSRSPGGFQVPPDAFLPHYSLASLGQRAVAGPFLKLVSYDPATGIYRWSVLVVCTKAAEQKLLAANTGDEARAALAAGGDGGGTVRASDSGGAPPLTPKLTWGEVRDSDGGGMASLPQSAEGELLHWWRDWRFWRFRAETTLRDVPQRLTYALNVLPRARFTFHLPARNAGAWRWAFHSCNGLDSLDNVPKSNGLQPLWQDVLARHAEAPLHVLVGGGDQLYNDSVFNGPLLKGWDRTLTATETAAKAALPFTAEMKDEVEEYYFAHYVLHFSQPYLGTALATIPTVHTWDDHDIVDGWGSYPPLIQNAPVMQGLFAAAQLFYLLFQQHTTPLKLSEDGFWAGSSQLHCFGAHTAVMLPDSRYARTTEQVHPPEAYEEMERRLRALPPSVSHLVVVQAIPVLYPKLDVLKELTKLSKRTTDDDIIAKLMGKTGLIRKIPLRFGQVEVLDDLLDHWDSRQHAAERDKYVRLMQSLSAERGFRVSFLSGDVHCAGYGMFHSAPPGRTTDEAVEHLRLPKREDLARDPKFIPQIISSAITNVPPPTFVLDALREEAEDPHIIMGDTVARMVALRRHAVIGTEDDDYLLVGERNWCLVSEPPPPPPPKDGLTGALLNLIDDGAAESAGALHFMLRCERKLGTGDMHSYTLEVPPLQRS